MADSPRNVTLAGIAKALGLTKGTISLALRDDPKINPATRQRIKAKATELGYVPHARFRTLAEIRWQQASHRDETIAIVKNSEAEDFGEIFHTAASKGAQELGYRTETYELRDYPSLLRLADVLYHRGIPGVFFPNRSGIETRLGEEWDRFACVAVGDRNEALGVELVRFNPFDSVSLCWKKVWEHGWRRIGGYFPHDPAGPSPYDIKRVAAFEYWQKNSNNERQPIPVLQSLVNDVKAFRKWYRQWRPEAIIALSTAAWRAPEYFAKLPLPAAYVASQGAQNEISGCHADQRQLQIAALNWLDQKIRRGQYGRASSGTTIVANPIWNEGETLPVRGEVA